MHACLKHAEHAEHVACCEVGAAPPGARPTLTCYPKGWSVLPHSSAECPSSDMLGHPDPLVGVGAGMKLS